MRSLVMCAVACVWITATAAPPAAAVTAFRITDLDLRDPHIFISFLGCRDITDTPLVGYSINGELQTLIQTDGDSDGQLDLNYVLLFDPLDQGGSGGTVGLARPDCTAPLATTTCTASSNPTSFSAYANPAGGPCLAALPGTLRPYSPAVASSAAPCFVTAPGPLTVDLGGGLVFSLVEAQFSATYSGNPATMLVSGLLRGFLPEATANVTLTPNEFPVIGGQPIASLFPGGDPPGDNNTNCASFSDKDVLEGTPGWWMYFNFVAAQVPYTDLTAVSGGAPSGLRASVAPNPFRHEVRFAYELPAAGAVRVSVFDLAGRHVADLVRGHEDAGRHAVTWDGLGSDGVPVPAGLYVIRLLGAGDSQSRTVAVVR